jgi:uncharacterized protein YbjT (DUF2867 family)
MKIVVVGGSGLIGTHVVDKLRQRSHEVLVASPRTGVNTLTGEGLLAALAHAQVVVDVTNAPTFADAMEFFTSSTSNLLAAEATTSVPHHVALSIVGSERLLNSGYFRAKVAQEELIKDGSIPYSIVRATQVFEFIPHIADAATDGNTVRLAPALIQPIAAQDVARAICDVALGTPLQTTVEVAGPERFRLDDLIRRALDAWNDPRLVASDARASYFGAELDDHTLLPGDDCAKFGATRLEEWLRSHSAAG